MTNYLFILNEAAYGNERSFNALRLAGALGSQTENHLRVFLIGDAVSCVKAGQKVPEGFYNLQLMVNKVLRQGEMAACGSCLDARGIAESELINGVSRGSMPQLAKWTSAADKVLVF